MADVCENCAKLQREVNEQRFLKLEACAELSEYNPPMLVTTDDFIWMIERLRHLGEQVDTLKLAAEQADDDDGEDDGEDDDA